MEMQICLLHMLASESPGNVNRPFSGVLCEWALTGELPQVKTGKLMNIPWPAHFLLKHWFTVVQFVL